MGVGGRAVMLPLPHSHCHKLHLAFAKPGIPTAFNLHILSYNCFGIYIHFSIPYSKPDIDFCKSIF